MFSFPIGTLKTALTWPSAPCRSFGRDTALRCPRPRSSERNGCDAELGADGAAETVSKPPLNDVFSLSSIRWRRGPGRGGVLLFKLPLSSVLSPLVPRGERKKSASFETTSARRPYPVQGSKARSSLWRIRSPLDGERDGVRRRFGFNLSRKETSGASH